MFLLSTYVKDTAIGEVITVMQFYYKLL